MPVATPSQAPKTVGNRLRASNQYVLRITRLRLAALSWPQSAVFNVRKSLMVVSLSNPVDQGRWIVGAGSGKAFNSDVA